MPPPARRILSIWFPRMGAERLLRIEGADHADPFAVVEETGNTQLLSSLSLGATRAGLRRGQPLRDAQAMCPELRTRLRNAQREAAFLTVLRRWMGKYSPWVAEVAPESLLIDITGCAHLFGGEEGMLRTLGEDLADLGLSHMAGIADTPGAAWALARYAGQAPGHRRTGDAVDAEAPATRSRAARRHWSRGGAAPTAPVPVATAGGPGRIAAPGQARAAIAPLPIAALRLDAQTQDQLARLGLRTVAELLDQPRGPLARRFGRHLTLRIDQALGHVPEPVSPARADRPDAVRMTLPDPIGLESDLLAGLDRLLDRLCATLRARSMGVRTLRLEAYRTDGTMQWITAGLARPSADPDRARPLLAMKVPEIDAGFGIDMLRLEAVQVEPVHATQTRGHIAATQAAADRQTGDHALDDLITRIGARVGMEAVTRLHPASSHIPEKTALTLAAAWSEPAPDWPLPPVARPLLLWPPEPVQAPDHPALPDRFRWRRRDLSPAGATGPERIAPEWWLDDPAWRSGTRDYWRVTVTGGERLWLFYAHGGTMSSGWFCQGKFA